MGWNLKMSDGKGVIVPHGDRPGITAHRRDT